MFGKKKTKEQQPAKMEEKGKLRLNPDPKLPVLFGKDQERQDAEQVITVTDSDGNPITLGPDALKALMNNKNFDPTDPVQNTIRANLRDTGKQEAAEHEIDQGLLSSLARLKTRVRSRPTKDDNS